MVLVWSNVAIAETLTLRSTEILRNTIDFSSASSQEQKLRGAMEYRGSPLYSSTNKVTVPSSGNLIHFRIKGKSLRPHPSNPIGAPSGSFYREWKSDSKLFYNYNQNYQDGMLGGFKFAHINELDNASAFSGNDSHQSIVQIYYSESWENGHDFEIRDQDNPESLGQALTTVARGAEISAYFVGSLRGELLPDGKLRQDPFREFPSDWVPQAKHIYRVKVAIEAVFLMNETTQSLKPSEIWFHSVEGGDAGDGGIMGKFKHKFREHVNRKQVRDVFFGPVYNELDPNNPQTIDVSPAKYVPAGSSKGGTGRRAAIELEGSTMFTASPAVLVYQSTLPLVERLAVPLVPLENCEHATMNVSFRNENIGTFQMGGMETEALNYVELDIAQFQSQEGDLTFTLNNEDSTSASVFLPERIIPDTGDFFELEKVFAPPAITQQPLSQTIAEGGLGSFVVVADGSRPMTYTWSKDGQEVYSTEDELFIFNNVTTSDAGRYHVVITNADGSVTSQEAILTVERAPTTPEPFPHPADRQPTDWRLDINEVTAYGVAWLTGQPWPTGPNPIDINHVTRAGAIWRSGESYTIDHSNESGAPLWWVSESESADE